MNRYDISYRHKCPVCGKETQGFDYWGHCCSLTMFPLNEGDSVSRSFIDLEEAKK